MSGIVNKIYIQNLQHTHVDEVKDVGIMSFMKGLERAYTKEKTNQVMTWLIKNNSPSSNLKEFQTRVVNALSKDGLINGPDQVYIADLVKKHYLGQLKN